MLISKQADAGRKTQKLENVMKNEIRIIYLEDNPADAELFDWELRRNGLNFHSRRVDTREAFLRELELQPDVILSDHGLPSFDGFTALGLAQEKCPAVPFIFVTDALSETEIKKLTDGVADCVLKSELNYLPTAVRRALLHHEEERHLHPPRLPATFGLWNRSWPICSSCKKIRTKKNSGFRRSSFSASISNLISTTASAPIARSSSIGNPSRPLPAPVNVPAFRCVSLNTAVF
jgi:CheY-like chemotaxis protein